MTAPLRPAPVAHAGDDLPRRPRLVDGHGRGIDYLRLSLTDRCNFRCQYCRSGPEVPLIPHRDLLTLEEMLDLTQLIAEMGIRKVRLTGGEPLLRKNFLWFLEQLRDRSERRGLGLDIRLTTNAALLAPMVPALHDLGIRAVNISLDSLDRATFAHVTGADALPQVLAGIDACLERGMRVKLNAVAMKGVSESELPGFIDFARRHGVEARFIEFMPMGVNTAWSDLHFLPSSWLLHRARQLASLSPVSRRESGGGPAEVYWIDGGPGRLGFISPLSNHFCGSCNRLRVTCDGRLRTCLFSDKEFKLRDILRHPRLGLPWVRDVIDRARKVKPIGAEILKARQRMHCVAEKRMHAIGG